MNPHGETPGQFEEPGSGFGERRGRYDVGRLLAVAVDVFIEQGYDGTTMEDLARAAGISKSSIYHHVESKEELLRLALDRALAALISIGEEENVAGPDAIDRLARSSAGSSRCCAPSCRM